MCHLITINFKCWILNIWKFIGIIKIDNLYIFQSFSFWTCLICWIIFKLSSSLIKCNINSIFVWPWVQLTSLVCFMIIHEHTKSLKYFKFTLYSHDKTEESWKWPSNSWHRKTFSLAVECLHLITFSFQSLKLFTYQLILLHILFVVIYCLVKLLLLWIKSSNFANFWI